jgi:hypothetical protein
MGFSLRTIADTLQFPEAVSLDALAQAIPQASVEAVVVDLGVAEQRTRKLPAALTLLLCIAMGLFTNIALTQVLRKLVQGVRYIWPGDEDYETANLRWQSPPASAERILWGAYPPMSSPSLSARCRMVPIWPTSTRPTTRAGGRGSASWCG